MLWVRYELKDRGTVLRLPAEEQHPNVSYPIRTRILYAKIRRPGCETGLRRLRMREAIPPRPHTHTAVLPYYLWSIKRTAGSSDYRITASNGTKLSTGVRKSRATEFRAVAPKLCVSIMKLAPCHSSSA